ncbi:response regulator transcription factor [Paenibacillus cymbidii]|uniref:response regulator transcription factor n=1 Tax=Paenibacillus cymbidii TaxID=1639034 RepID=UPI0010810FA3|nr:response regulator transcription factor [Paenibacillus cymbidii]
MKVLIVDDEPAMLLALKRMLSGIDGVELVGSFRSAAETLDFVRRGNVDLAILDIMIAADDGLALARSLRSIRAELDIVFTTSHAEFALPAYDVYPLDYIVKPISAVRLAQSIARAVNRRSSSSAPEQPAANEEALSTPLTSREKDVLRGIAAGWSNEEIAEQLQISLSTVKVHTRHVFAKLEVHNRVSAVTRAQRLSLLDEDGTGQQ